MTPQYEERFSPGPWEASESSNFIVGVDGYSVAEVTQTRFQNARANKRLIVASPDLLRVAEDACGIYYLLHEAGKLPDFCREPWRKAAVVVRRAKGLE